MLYIWDWICGYVNILCRDIVNYFLKCGKKKNKINSGIFDWERNIKYGKYYVISYLCKYLIYCFFKVDRKFDRV